MDPEDTDYGLNQRPKLGFRIYENFRNIVKKSRSNYDLSVANCPTYEDVEVTGSHALNSLDSSMTTDSLNVIKNDGNTTDDSGIDSIDQSSATGGITNNSSPEPFYLRLDQSNYAESSLLAKKTFPIYSSVVKKKSNPARDFALTVLENDKKSVKIKENCDLTEISQLLSSTNQLLSRNSHLRASLTIRVQRSKNSSTTTEVVDIPLIDRKDSTSGDSGNASGSSGDDKCSSEEESSESTLPSLEPNINPFTRHNPARRPINGGHHSMEVRRSVRLAPKTVATLASKFDNLLTLPNSASSAGNVEKSKTSSSTMMTSRGLGKKDIAQIIGTLEKLDSEAKKASEILQKNKKKADQIDNLMKTTKSALEEVELPSQDVKEEEQSLETISSTTDKYLQTLQKIAKENAETGQFRTSMMPKQESIAVLHKNEEKVTASDSAAPIDDHDDHQDKDESVNIEEDDYEELKQLDLLVTARPAIVTEDQMDSLSFYDDVRAPSLGGDLYESIAGSILNLAKRNSSMEDMYSSVLYSPSSVKPVNVSPIFCCSLFFVSNLS